jgi:FkbM family methyltransferase
MISMFSLTYLYKAAKIFLLNPLALTRLVYDTENALAYIDMLRKQKWAQNPVARKRVYGYYIELDTNDAKGVSAYIGTDGWYEPEPTELLKKLLKKGMVVIDVGANIGWYTLLSAKIVGPNGLVLSYEPEPRNYSLLRKSIDENKFTNIRTFQSCVSNVIGEKTLWLASENLASHSIIMQRSDKGIPVKSTTLDSIIDNFSFQTIDLLKIDAEGAEPEIIEGGMRSLMESRIENIIMEWDPKVWISRVGLMNKLLDKFEIHQFIRSPFLVKRVGKKSLLNTPLSNIYLHVIE